ncbi:hypothetical protein EYF80_006027 [Liparis tanakae]|uniref:Uncharacterized protein n=1 Tax=Liparis tanakae TaxID=230148 RepID=A0A4Z2J1K1_9TELE|nr:hypothetical protein EYF80_006027 [Liparis tanakae]
MEITVSSTTAQLKEVGTLSSATQRSPRVVLQSSQRLPDCSGWQSQVQEPKSRCKGSPDRVQTESRPSPDRVQTESRPSPDRVQTESRPSPDRFQNKFSTVQD